MGAIEARNLAKIYGRGENRVRALADASLRVEGLEGRRKGVPEVRPESSSRPIHVPPLDR